jgi:hypothetical protein
MVLEVHLDHWSNGPRVGARGVVIVDGLILLLKYEQGDETAYLFPGGGHEPGETLAETAHRVDTLFECHVVGDTMPHMNVAPDNLHTEFMWVALDELDDIPIMPKIANQLRESLGHSGDPMLSESF